MSEIKKILGENETKTPEAATQVNADVNNLEKSLKDEKDARARDAERIANLEFDNSFKDITTQFPEAKEFQADIKEKTKSGMSVADATYAVLGAKGKFKAPASNDGGDNFGGSGATVAVKSKSKKSRDELEKDFKDLEAKGEIKLV